MTVSTLTNSVTYVGNGVATSFAVPFKVLDKDHLVVRRRLLATGAIDYTYIGTDYTYSGLGDDSGTLTLGGTALASTYQLEIERIVPYVQELDIVNAGGFYPETVEEQLDLMTMQIQQIDAIAERAILLPFGMTMPGDWADIVDLFKGDTGPAGSGNIVGLHADDFMTHSNNTSSVVAANNAGLAEINALAAAAGGVRLTLAEGVTYWVGGLENQPYSAVEIAGLYNWYPTVEYLLDFDGLSHVFVDLNGSTIKNRAGSKFGTFDPVAGTPRSPATMPYSGMGSTGLATPFFAMIRVKNCTGIVEIKNGILDGNRAGTEIGSGYGDVGIQIPFTGIDFEENEAVISIENVDAVNFGLDGFRANEGFTATLTDPRQRWRAVGCATNDNGRNGVSIVGGRGLFFQGGQSNGNGAYSNPKSGFDIEAEFGKFNRDIIISGYDLIDNSAQAVVADTGDSADILVEDCRIAKFTAGASGYVLWPEKENIKFSRCKIFGTVVAQYDSGDSPYPADSVLWEECIFSNDPANSPTAAVITVNNLLFDGGSAFVEMVRCKFIHNDPDLGSNGNTDAMLFTDCTFVALAGQLDIYGRVRGKTAFIQNGGIIGTVPGPLVAGKTNMGYAEDSWTYRTGGVTTSHPATFSRASGTAILTGSKTHNFGSIANGAQETTTVTVTGAALGDFIPYVSLSIDHGGLDLSAYVSAADTATVIAKNSTGGAVDLASATLSVRGFKKP